MNFIMIGLLLREALDRLRVRLNMYLVYLLDKHLHNKHVLITFSRNGFGDICRRIVTSILHFIGKMSFVCRCSMYAKPGVASQRLWLSGNTQGRMSLKEMLLG